MDSEDKKLFSMIRGQDWDNPAETRFRKLALEALASVPKPFWHVFLRQAWNSNHSFGLLEVVLELEELIDEFKPAIFEFEEQINNLIKNKS